MPPATPIRSCSRWGLPCRDRYRPRGALLPHRFTLACGLARAGGLFSVALSLGSLKVEKVLLMVAALSDEAVQARAPAIFKAMACVEGCDTAQHRADLLRTRARNHRGAFSPAIQQAAASLLKGAGYSL